MRLKRVDDARSHAWLEENAAVPKNIITVDAASAIYVDDSGKRYRLPKGDLSFDKPGPLGPERIDREVCTERDLFNCGRLREGPADCDAQSTDYGLLLLARSVGDDGDCR